MGTKHRGSAAERRALDAYTRLMRAAASVTTRLERRLRAVGLTEPQFGVLEMLYHLGPLRPQTITRKQFKTGGNTTYVVHALERGGWVRCEPDPDDGRAIRVALTPKGRRRIEAIFPGQAAAIVEEFSILTAAEQEELGRLARILGTRERTPERRPPTAGSAPGGRSSAAGTRPSRS